MPEYLAPDVYVEEIDTGSKPIEGVSTSTAGMLGVSEWGPANVPILVTSYGEYQRWFGGLLDPDQFRDPITGLHCFLPHAVDGFFTNGGKRVYVTRVEARGSARADFMLHNRGDAASAATRLLRASPELSGTGAADAAYVVDIDSPNAGALANNNHIRVGRGSETEYRDVAAAGIGNANHVSLNFPLARSHAAATMAHEITRAVIAIAPQPVLEESVPAGAATILVRVGAVADIAIDHLLEIGNDPLSAEHRFVTAVATISAVPPIVLRVTLDSPLHVTHGNPAVAGPPVPAINATRLDPGPGAVDVANNPIEAGRDAGIGDRVVYLAAPFATPAPVPRANLVIFERAALAPPNGVRPREARRIGLLSRLLFAFGAYDNYDAAARVAGVNVLSVAPPRTLTAAVFAGSNVVAVDNRVGIIENSGMVLQVGAAAPFEYVPIAGVPNRAPGNPPAPPDAGQLQLAYGLQRAYPQGTPAVVVQTPVPLANRPRNVAALAIDRGDTTVAVTDGGDPVAADRYALNDLVRITTPTGATFLHQLAANAVAANARAVTITVPFARPHAAGSPIAERAVLIRVRALDTGSWGNRLRVSVVDENPGLVARTAVVTAIAPNRLRLDSASGVEPGTILELSDATATLVTTVKVRAVERATGEVTLDPGVVLTGPQVAAVNAVPRAFTVRSREFRISMRLLAPRDPSVPTSVGTVLDTEVFRNLSLDPRHTRYVQTVVGDINGSPRLSDRRPDGESWYIRVRDLAQDLPEGPPAAAPYRLPTLNSIRLGPEPLTDLLSDGREEPARHPLAGGDDSMATIDDNAYIGADNANPENRTGLFSLRNIEDISIVAVPGRTSTVMQNALINHCEIARYRFAVLDAHRPPRDSMADVINQRQQFDTKYAAIYHPWLLIPPPFPMSAAQPDEYPIPPAGHVVGIYARTDIERGVHKAPANEVVRGVVGLQRLLNKGEHDILNPYPININVIRDFRPNARGIRVYGGRVITSDPDWKYVNVRRLLIFIEASINRGLQWVVFEPNAEPLWARVRRSISNFLTLVWRNGALEGTKVEEAYFVKCDRTTMTQTDIDSGRLICIVGVAPVKPAEFVIVRIGLWTAHAEE
jgi:phage tail sheath protein FI